jgi:hypothetical protein
MVVAEFTNADDTHPRVVVGTAPAGGETTNTSTTAEATASDIQNKVDATTSDLASKAESAASDIQKKVESSTSANSGEDLPGMSRLVC